MITDEAFVTAWAKSKSVEEVAKRLGRAKCSVQVRAGRLRKAGVKLPRHPRPKKVTDVTTLNKLLKKLLP